MTFQDATEIDIAVDVPEAVMVNDIRTADVLELVAEFAGVPGRRFPVQIREISQVADPVTQTFRVRVAMQPPEDVKLLPGMTGLVSANYRRAAVLQNGPLVPVSAIYKTSSGEQVAWVIDSKQTVARRPVKIGSAAGGKLEVIEGLLPGDRIAVAGVPFLREGMKVRDLGDALGGVQQ